MPADYVLECAKIDELSAPCEETSKEPRANLVEAFGKVDWMVFSLGLLQ